MRGQLAQTKLAGGTEPDPAGSSQVRADATGAVFR